MGELALRALDLPRSERNMTGLTLGMSEKCYAEVVKELAECRRRIVALVQSDPVVEKVYRLNMQLFPMTEKIDERPLRHPEGQNPEGAGSQEPYLQQASHSFVHRNSTQQGKLHPAILGLHLNFPKESSYIDFFSYFRFRCKGTTFFAD